MKIKKSIIQAIFIGVTAAGTASCGLFGDVVEQVDPETGEVIDTESEDPRCYHDDNCPACGLG